jgi:putative phosphotransacetylase
METGLDKITEIVEITLKTLKELGVAGVSVSSDQDGKPSVSGSGHMSGEPFDNGSLDFISGSGEQPYPLDPMLMPTYISTREVSLTSDDAERLFGAGHKFTVDGELSGGGVNIYTDIVTVAGPDGEAAARITDVNADVSSVRLLACDRNVLGINAPLRKVDDLEDSAPAEIKGPDGSVKLEQGAVIPQRYISVAPEEADGFGISKNQIVSVRCVGSRGGLLTNVAVKFAPEGSPTVFHLDAEEADAMMVRKGAMVKLEK